jgi:hypothetical protein
MVLTFVRANVISGYMLALCSVGRLIAGRTVEDLTVTRTLADDLNAVRQVEVHAVVICCADGSRDDGDAVRLGCADQCWMLSLVRLHGEVPERLRRLRQMTSQKLCVVAVVCAQFDHDRTFHVLHDFTEAFDDVHYFVSPLIRRTMSDVDTP